MGSSKKRFCHNKPHTLAELEANIEAEIAIIQEKELKSMAVNSVICAQQCLDVGGEHFQCLLQISDTGYF
jgi:hypothetical protein